MRRGGSENMVGDKKYELPAVLSKLLGRQVKAREVIDALGMPTSTYYLQRDEDRLITADNLLKLAGELDVNPVGLLARYGFVSELSVVEYAEELNKSHTTSKPEPLRARRDAPPL